MHRFYCTEGAALKKIVETCKLPPAPPPAGASVRVYRVAPLSASLSHSCSHHHSHKCSVMCADMVR